MLKNKNLIVPFMLMFLLVASPLIAAEKGSGLFNVPADLTVAGVNIDEGKYNVQWEAVEEESDEVEVQFELVNTNQVLAVKGNIVRTEKKYGSNNIGIGMDASGQKTIKLLQFGGKKLRIVF